MTRPTYHYEDPEPTEPPSLWSCFLGGLLIGFLAGVILAFALGLVQ